MNNKGNPDPKIELRDATDGKLIWRAEADRGTAFGLAISPNGRLVANSTYLGIDLRDAETGRFLRKINVAETNPTDK